MKLLVFSDSHGRTEPMASILAAHADTADAVLHLGDGAAEVLTLRARYPGLPFYAVMGNCDSASYSDFGITDDRLLTVGDHTLYFCHGDRFGVGGGTAALAAYAAYRGADIVLFGHTHVAQEVYLPDGADAKHPCPMFILSPGSVSRPRDSTQPSFGILDITDRGVLFSVGRVGDTRTCI